MCVYIHVPSYLWANCVHVAPHFLFFPNFSRFIIHCCWLYKDLILVDQTYQQYLCPMTEVGGLSAMQHGLPKSTGYQDPTWLTPTHLLRTVIANCEVECILRAKHSPVTCQAKIGVSKEISCWFWLKVGQTCSGQSPWMKRAQIAKAVQEWNSSENSACRFLT